MTAQAYRPDAIVLRETRTDRPGWVFSEPPGPRPEWEPLHGKAGALTARFWLDEDGIHVWQVHTCASGERLIGMLPWPTWQVIDHGEIAPSVDCSGCGYHMNVSINCVVVDSGNPVTEMLVAARSDPEFAARRAARWQNGGSTPETIKPTDGNAPRATP